MASRQAPFIMKMRFLLPQGKSGDKNAAHVSYIERRARQFEREDDDATIHAKYMCERPGSAGLFGSNGGENVKDVQQELRKHPGVVWRFVLSLREDDALAMGITSKSDWERAVRGSVTDAAAAMGIPADNLRWAAAFHNAQGHPHVHLMVWEHTPRFCRGKISNKKLRGVRRAFVNEFYREERNRLLAERTVLRDSARAAAVAILSGQTKPTYSGELERRLSGLNRQQPGKGRVNLAFMPPETKAAARETASWLLEQDDLRGLKDEYLERVRSLTRHYTTDEDKIAGAECRALDDLRDRVAQIVLRAALQVPDLPEQAQAVHSAAHSLLSGLAGVRRRASADRGDAAAKTTLKTLGEEKYLRYKLKDRMTLER